jgi:5'-3' exonuclease
MGVPKFYRWLSERYPLINQRHGVRPGDDLAQEHMGRTPSDALPRPDPLSTCGLPPPIDRLYIDMNGIIHGCSHNNQSSVIHDAILSDEDGGPDTPDENAVADITEPEIFRNIAYYLDRIVKEIAQPRELMYIAIDGVAPRAKLNQQRARRYRSAQEGEIERTVYDAHRQSVQEAQEQQQQQQQQSYGTTIDDETAALLGSDDLSGLSSHPSLTARASATSSGNDEGSGGLREVEPGRFAGKFETTQTTPTDAAGSPSSLEGHHAQDSLLPNGNDSTTDDAGDDATELFHSNYITPGTPFFQRCTAYLEDYLRDKVANDPAWQHLQVILSGPNTPGEGEHKIMQFMREQKQRPEYDPNLRHCIMGQDGDLIMLGLVTHEPNLMLLREQVLFDKKRRAIEPLAQKYGVRIRTPLCVRRARVCMRVVLLGCDMDYLRCTCHLDCGEQRVLSIVLCSNLGD